MTDPDGYPHALAGPPAPPPEVPDRRLLGMALKAHARHLAAVRDQLVTAAPWRCARAVSVLLAEANSFAPHRHTASDGTIGDARHQSENGPHGPGSGSDHNPWVIVAGKGVVRALDLTNDPVLQLPTVAERIRVAAHAGRLPQVTGGGYLILAGRITAPDFSGWHAYTGADPHVSHLHVSVSLEEAQFDSAAPWGAFTSEPHPAPAVRDLAGHGAALRGEVGDTGPRVKELQAFCNRYAPAYSHLVVDGIWGPATTAVLREFAHRAGIDEADGRNIGPQIAAALYRAGFDRPAAPTRTSARDRVLGHRNRPGRR